MLSRGVNRKSQKLFPFAKSLKTRMNEEYPYICVWHKKVPLPSILLCFRNGACCYVRVYIVSDTCCFVRLYIVNDTCCDVCVYIVNDT